FHNVCGFLAKALEPVLLQIVKRFANADNAMLLKNGQELFTSNTLKNFAFVCSGRCQLVYGAVSKFKIFPLTFCDIAKQIQVLDGYLFNLGERFAAAESGFGDWFSLLDQFTKSRFVGRRKLPIGESEVSKQPHRFCAVFVNSAFKLVDGLDLLEEVLEEMVGSETVTEADH